MRNTQWIALTIAFGSATALIALVPLFVSGGAERSTMDLGAAAFAIATILGVVVVGRFLLARLYYIVAATGVREAMTASALLTVVGVALVMEAAGRDAAVPRARQRAA
jgi:Kef-type K+ transport system membrane component KefB